MRLCWISAAAAALALASGQAPANAACDVSITPLTGAPSVGKIVKGTSNTTFTFPISGSVTQSPSASTAGAAILLHPTSVTGYPLQVTITSGPSCSGNGRTVTLSASPGSGPQFVTQSYTVSAVSGASNVSTSTVSSSPGSFTFDFTLTGNGRAAVFKIGSVVRLTASSGTGVTSWTTTVAAN